MIGMWIMKCPPKERVLLKTSTVRTENLLYKTVKKNLIVQDFVSWVSIFF